METCLTGCTKLTSAPLINIENASMYECQRMFQNCSSLVDVSKITLITKSLGTGQYQNMFYNCASLEIPPEIQATTIGSKSLEGMFNGCSKLKELRVHFTEYNDSGLTNWVNGVPATGTFYKLTALPEEFGVNRIPEGWTVVNIDAPEITVETPVTLTGTQNTAITNLQLTATVSDNGTPTFTSSDLPAGLTLSNTGLISGTPTGSGEGTSTITVSYDGAESKTITLNWTIEAAASDEKTYVYTVSECRNADVNGDYYLTDQTYNNKPVYSNGKVYLSTYYMSDVGSNYVCFGTTLGSLGLFYQIGSTIPLGSNLWVSTSDYYEYPITIAEYVNLSGDIKYVATGAAINEVNGNYHDNGDNTYTNAAGYTIEWLASYGEWGITDPTNGAIIYKGSNAGSADENSVYLGQWYSDVGYDPAPVISEYVAPFNGYNGDKVCQYYVSGFPNEDANGGYYSDWNLTHFQDSRNSVKNKW